MTTLIILSVVLALVVIAVLAGALIKIRRDLEATSAALATLATALTTVEQEHLKPLEPAVTAINAQFDTILSALPGIAAETQLQNRVQTLLAPQSWEACDGRMERAKSRSGRLVEPFLSPPPLPLCRSAS